MIADRIVVIDDPFPTAGIHIRNALCKTGVFVIKVSRIQPFVRIGSEHFDRAAGRKSADVFALPGLHLARYGRAVDIDPPVVRVRIKRYLRVLPAVIVIVNARQRSVGLKCGIFRGACFNA